MKMVRVPKSGSSRKNGSDSNPATAAAMPEGVADADVPATVKEKKTTRKKGKTEENSAKVPRVRQVYGLFAENQKRGVKKYPTNAEIGRFLDPASPLSDNAVRAILDMMRD